MKRNTIKKHRSIDQVGMSVYNLAISKLIDVLEKRWVDSALVGNQAVTVVLTELKSKTPQVDVSYVCDNPCDRDYRLQIKGKIRVAFTKAVGILRHHASCQDDRSLSVTVVIKTKRGIISVKESEVLPSDHSSYTLVRNGVSAQAKSFRNWGVVAKMPDHVVLRHIREFVALPSDPIVHRLEKLKCRCGHHLLLICDSSEMFHPAYHFCPDCKAITRLGVPSGHCNSIGCPSNKMFCICPCGLCKPRRIF